jgi:Ca-activated chloride channel family protein
MRNCNLVIALLVVGAVVDRVGYAQSVRSLVNGGNRHYNKENYTEAEVNYRKALEKEPGLVQGHFNLGNSLYKQKKFDESDREFENALQRSEDKETKADAYYNLGNSLLKAQRYQDAVRPYIESLKLAPSDPDAKYNLSYALAKLREQQQQQQNKNDKNKNNKQQKQEQQKQDQDRQKQDQQQQQRQQQAQQEKKMSKADAERILDVLKNNERNVQKKLRNRQAVRIKPDRDW